MKKSISTALILSTLSTTFPTVNAGEDYSLTTKGSPLSSGHCTLCDEGHGRPDAHAPIGVMGDHVHAKGQWMASYRYMNMRMDDLYQGSDTIPNTLAASGFMMTPTDMQMEMHMVGIMYAPTDKLTLMAMLNYQEISMNMANGMGQNAMSMRTSGVGDTSIGGLYQFFKKEDANAHFGLNLSTPTGATDKKLTNGTGADQPFNMQLGSGSFGLTPSITYNHFLTDTFSYGAQAKYTTYLDENDEGYTLGDRFAATTWFAQQIHRSVSLSTRIQYNVWDGIDGTQNNSVNNIMPNISSAADASNSGGQSLDAFIGANYLHKSGLRLAVEYGKTLHQDLDGVQLGYDWQLIAGAQFAF
ncbi:transporter [Akkermansiaceae bacterium]|nr:transporter [Akkermansiaceae bacterium]